MIALPAGIRFATPGDAERIAEIYAPYCTDTLVSFEVEAPGADEILRRMERLTVRYPWLVWVPDGYPDGRVAGYAYAGPHRERLGYQWSTDVTVYLDADYHGQGGGRGLYSALFDLLTAQGFYNAYAGIALPNPASVGIHEKFGFELVGVYREVGFKFDRWVDVAWYVRELQPKVGSPVPPIDLTEMRLKREQNSELGS